MHLLRLRGRRPTRFSQGQSVICISAGDSEGLLQLGKRYHVAWCSSFCHSVRLEEFPNEWWRYSRFKGMSKLKTRKRS